MYLSEAYARNYWKEVRSYVLLLPKSFILAKIVFPRVCDIAFWKLATRFVSLLIKNFLTYFSIEQYEWKSSLNIGKIEQVFRQIKITRRLKIVSRIYFKNSIKIKKTSNRCNSEDTHFRSMNERSLEAWNFTL